jgi:DNA mismatch repair protein MutS2
MRLESLVLSLETANKQLEDRLSETATAAEAAERDRLMLEERLERLQAERDDIRKKAVDEAEEIIRSANRAVERAVREIRESQADAERTREARKRIEKERSRLAERSKRLKRRSSARTVSHATGKSDSTQPTPVDPALHVGDVVRLEDAGAEGEILSLKGEEALVRLGDLQTRVALKRLRKVSGAREQRVTIRQSERSGGSLASARLEQRIDVRGCRVDEAIPRVVALVDEAAAAGLDRVEILHGKGTGALRQAVQEYLSGSGQVSRVEEAPWNEGGAGVTIAWLSG